MTEKKQKTLTTTSYHDGDTLAEMVYDPETNKTALAVRNKEGTNSVPKLTTKDGKTLRPYSADHPLINNQVILFAQSPEAYGKTADLIKNIRSYIHHYVDLSDEFEIIATHYALLTWLYDTHNTLGYLRMKGDFGSGKTRFLTIIGSICYKPIFASGAATVAPLFHILNDIGGTLIMDESDFYQSNEKSLIAKILNNGNSKGFPVLRCEKTPKQTFTTRAFSVFGPKILATRGNFDDAALESRFLTENAGVRPLRADVPLSLPKEQATEAQTLRNQLLQFRFDHFHKDFVLDGTSLNKISPRMQQVVSPLLQFMDKEDQGKIVTWAGQQQKQQQRDQGMELPAHVLTILIELLQSQSSAQIGQIRNRVMEEYGDHYEHPLTAKAVGMIVRNSLHLSTRRIRGRYVVHSSEKDKVALLAKRYGLDNVT